MKRGFLRTAPGAWCVDAHDPVRARRKQRFILSGMTIGRLRKKEKHPAATSRFECPQHPNEDFGCRAARTRCGPVIANPPLPHGPPVSRCQGGLPIFMRG